MSTVKRAEDEPVAARLDHPRHAVSQAAAATAVGTAPQEASIAVIGGGIGGLCVALSLLAAGFDVPVYEQARTLSEVGAGVQVGPNASRILHGLGLAEDWSFAAVAWIYEHDAAVLDDADASA